LNYGALPVPIELISTQTVSGTLGEKAVQDGIMAGLWGIGAVALFMILWYRLPGFVASLALLLYIAAVLALFMLIPVTMTAAGIAAFILSVGMAVDANVLIFERIKEELRSGKVIAGCYPRRIRTRMALDPRQQYFFDDYSRYSLLVWNIAHQRLRARVWSWRTHLDAHCYFSLAYIPHRTRY
jgi:hypothetical protein